MRILARFRRLGPRERRALVIGLLFISPWAIGFLAFRLYPFFASLYYSFTFYPALETPRWIGLRNFQRLFEDTRFLTSLYNSAYYALFAVPLSTISAILLAMVLNLKVM